MPAATSQGHRAVNMFAPMSESAMLLSDISTSLDVRKLCSLYSAAVTVSDADTGTRCTCDGTVCDSCSCSSHRTLSATVSSERHSSVTPENPARKWSIGINTAKKTLQVMMQRGVTTAVHPLHKRYRVDHLHLNRRRLNGDWFTDTLVGRGGVRASFYRKSQNDPEKRGSEAIASLMRHPEFDTHIKLHKKKLVGTAILH